MKNVKKSAVLKELLENVDEKYADFNARLIPTLERSRILGVRMPILRKIAKQKERELVDGGFLAELPHDYQEENMLQAIVVSDLRDFERCAREIEQFLSFVDNWAVCDALSPKAMSEHKGKTLARIDEWLKSEQVYTVRFAVSLLMQFFLDEDFCEEHLVRVAKIKHENYYVKMMQAWYFATALAKHWEETILYLERKDLDIFVHNKTIQKAIESRRISMEQKQYLRGLKIKE